MNALTKICILIFTLLSHFALNASYLTYAPVTVNQPDGTELNIFATGDEFYNWLHDENGFTIIKDETDGYYCYAELVNDQLVPTDILPGVDDPEVIGLRPNVNLPSEIIAQSVDYYIEDITPSITRTDFTNAQGQVNLNNIVVYIRFADQEEFTDDHRIYNSMYNDSGSNINSVKNYFTEASYNKLNINSTFYPTNNGTTILTYQDEHPRVYYVPQKVDSRGYSDDEKAERENTLFANAINFVKTQIPQNLDIDFNNDDKVDNISFFIRGEDTGFGNNSILWPHRSALYLSNEVINGKAVYDYIVLVEWENRVGIICHEIMHVLGAPDLYHANSNSKPVGSWDIMASNVVYPMHPTAHIKQWYLGWIDNMPVINTSGTFTLNPLTSPTNNCYKIPIPNSYQYLVLEYRQRTGTFESAIPASGLLISRINDNFRGNYSNGDEVPGGVNDEVYIFRPGGSVHNEGNYLRANFGNNVGRNKFNQNTDPYCFLSEGSTCVVAIKNISDFGGATMSFDVDFCNENDVIYSNTSLLPTVTEAVNITTNNVVIVGNNTTLTFEASQEVQLNGNFETKTGVNFTARTVECGEQ